MQRVFLRHGQSRVSIPLRTAFEFGNDSRGEGKRLFHAADRYGDRSSGSGVFLHHGGNLFLQPFEGDGLLFAVLFQFVYER